MSGDNDYLQNGLRSISLAVEAEKERDYSRALQYYCDGINRLEYALKYNISGEKAKNSVSSRLEEYRTRVQLLKDVIAKKDGKSKISDSGKNDESDVSESNRFKSMLSDAIVSEKPNVKWNDVAGLEVAKRALKEAVLLPISFPEMFIGNRQPWRGILLYGPPGTGKSYLAKAVATEANESYFLSISSSNLMSKWLGESEKLVKTLFDMARDYYKNEGKNTIIFIDEIDSLCTERSDSESESSRRIKTEFLVQMQGVGNSNDHMLVLGATNTPWQLDPAVRRRLEKRIYIPLPNESARMSMLQLNFSENKHSLTDDDFAYFAKMTDGYSGSDVATLARSALMKPIQKVQSSTHFKCVMDSVNGVKQKCWTPCSPGDKGAVECGWMDLGDHIVVEPPVSFADLVVAIEGTKPSVSKQDLVRYDKFTKEFGLDGV